MGEGHYKEKGTEGWFTMAPVSFTPMGIHQNSLETGEKRTEEREGKSPTDEYNQNCILL